MAENYSIWEISVGISEPVPKVGDDVPPYWAAVLYLGRRSYPERTGS
jgi:hypothetical protein